MTSATETGSAPATGAGDHIITLPSTDWDGFRAMLRIRGDRRSPRILYLDGSLTLVSPLIPHESLSRRLGLFVTEVAFGLGVPFTGIGSTTLGREVLDCGAEGDQEFYFASLERVLGKTELDLNVDPPPDLIIEVVVSHGATQAMEIYRRLGVPEVWVCTVERLRFYRLGGDGAYVESPNSVAIPWLTSTEVFAWVDQPPLVPMNEWLGRLRDWVRDELAPRGGGGGRPDGG